VEFNHAQEKKDKSEANYVEWLKNLTPEVTGCGRYAEAVHFESILRLGWEK
jgi:hypothetical protein